MPVKVLSLFLKEKGRYTKRETKAYPKDRCKFDYTAAEMVQIGTI